MFVNGINISRESDDNGNVVLVVYGDRFVITPDITAKAWEIQSNKTFASVCINNSYHWVEEVYDHIINNSKTNNVLLISLLLSL